MHRLANPPIYSLMKLLCGNACTYILICFVLFFSRYFASDIAMRSVHSFLEMWILCFLLLSFLNCKNRYIKKKNKINLQKTGSTASLLLVCFDRVILFSAYLSHSSIWTAIPYGPMHYIRFVLNCCSRQRGKQNTQKGLHTFISSQPIEQVIMSTLVYRRYIIIASWLDDLLYLH